MNVQRNARCQRQGNGGTPPQRGADSYDGGDQRGERAERGHDEPHAVVTADMSGGVVHE